MDVFSNTTTRLIVLKWGTQLGKTEIMLNCIGWAIDEAPGPILIVYPNETTMKKVSLTRLQPMIEACPSLLTKKDLDGNKFKIGEMHFLDCLVYLSSAQVPSDLASMPVQYLFCDELGKFPTYSGREGDPVSLAMERQKAFRFTSKTMLVSSPTTVGGPISRYFESCAERLTYWIPCPHCGVMQTLSFKHIKWDIGELKSSTPAAWRCVKETAEYHCRHCDGIMTDADKVAALSLGRWLREDGSDYDAKAESVGFHLSSLYSPLLTWGAIAAEFLQIKDDPPRLMVFLNGWLAQEWEEVAVIRKEPSQILTTNKTDNPPRVIPPNRIALTMGIDSQSAGFYFVVRAWARDRTSDLVDYGFLPSLTAVSDAVMNWSYPMQNDQTRRMGIWRACIDTGGTRLEEGPSMTEQIYHWLRRQPAGIIYGVKGSSWKTGVRVQTRIIDKMPGKQGKPIPGGIVLYLLDTAAFKEVLHYRLGIPPGEPGAFLLHADTDEDYAEQLLSEYKRRETRTGKEAWVPIAGRDNHYLDAEIYAMAATDTQFLGGLDVLHGPVAVAVAGAAMRRPQQGSDTRRVLSKGVTL